ncbi:MAG: type III-B CRISPR module RAMP protein Cmr6 [Deltaproteobacteria bacterium]|nr:MAG: type III-B CRISPR module RAMP protein Cmr6 [Deltaproteobacteria bacterium]
MTALAKWIKAARDPDHAPALHAPDVTPLPAHVGLWLDRCLIQQQVQGEASDDHADRQMLHDVARRALRLGGSTLPPAVISYRRRYERHRDEADAVSPGTSRRVIEASARTRVLLHPATGSTVTDGSLLLHHTYGVPYLPGSALKGICRHRAERLKADRVCLSGVTEWPRLLFGWTGEGDADGESGLFDFWDALWVPEPPELLATGDSDFTPLVEDIVNPHHGDYYTRKEDRPPPSDGDAPIPAHILTVAPGTRFLIVVESFAQGDQVKDLLDWVVTTLLRDALREDGIGARTRAGYGRLDLDLPAAAGNIASQGGARPSSLFEATKQPAHVALVSLNKSDRSLRAAIDGIGNIVLRLPAARTLFAALPSSVQRVLEKNRSVRLLVTWESVGNVRRIVALEADPASAPL